MNASEYILGKRVSKRIPSGQELIASITALCDAFDIAEGSFSVLGSVVSATIGVYDPSQEVYVTHVEKEATELLFCQGTVSRAEPGSRVTAKIILADQEGRLTGGHLFEKTIVYDAQIEMQELVDKDSQENS